MIKKRGKNIFLADDDVDDCMLFEDALREVAADTTLTTALDGMELMNILDESVPPPPDMIFLDLNMPRKNGFECLLQIRTDQKLKAIPVIIFSTSAQPEFIEQVYQSGANRYIRKPSSFAELRAAISEMLAIDWEINSNHPSRDNFYLSF
jgi:CheY-like chemotaxis protein